MTMGALDNNGASPDALDTRTQALVGEFDALKWAREFKRLNPDSDESLMHSWFANAIMAGYDYRGKNPTSDDIYAAANRIVDETYGPIRAEHARLVRQLDVTLNGAVGAAPQASLCDLVAQVERQRCVQVVNMTDGMRINFQAPDGRRATLHINRMLDRGEIDVEHAQIIPTMRAAIAAYPLAGEVPK